jgi:3-hydroxyisobutyrate dehydrogenase-like beta-hydroxyacid dehydrogenase
MAARDPVGVIGLGLLGTAFATRLIEAGIGAVGFDIDAARCMAFGSIGGIPAASAAAVMARCAMIIVAVFDAGQIRALLHEVSRNRNARGAVMICTTTCAPDDIADIAARAGRLGLGFVEAPVSGTSEDVRNGAATALVAGQAEAIEAAQPILDVLCPHQAIVGKAGDAARTKLAINLILQGNRTALAEGIAFAESMGLDAAAFLATARRSAAHSRVMDAKGEKMIARDFTPQSHIIQTLKDAELILAEARQRRQHLPITLVQAGLLRAAIALAGPDADSSAVIAAIRPSQERP